VEEWKIKLENLREEKEEQIAELKAMIQKLEKSVKARIEEIAELTEKYEDLEREMDQQIQTRDRQIKGLQNELQ
jgi:hypothetical protein